MNRPLVDRLRKILLGPATSYRNDNRIWLYSGFILLILLLVSSSRGFFR